MADARVCVRCERDREDGEIDITDDASDERDDELARSLTGQMPSMALFAETQQESVALRRSEQAWRNVQAAIRPKGQKRHGRWLALVLLPVVIVGMIAISSLPQRHSNVSSSTPVDSLPWRTVAAPSGDFTVELPADPQITRPTSDIGRGERLAASAPDTAVAVTAYAIDSTVRSNAALALDVLALRASELGDTSPAARRVRPASGRWGDVYDYQVMINGQPTGRLRASVVDSTVYLFEAIGSPASRNDQIFGRVVNSWSTKLR